VTDDLRTRLAGALTAFADLDPELADECAAAVLPLVEAHGRASAATALRQAADAMAWPNSQNCGPELRERADRLEARS
jgi:hypothetical protein